LQVCRTLLLHTCLHSLCTRPWSACSTSTCISSDEAVVQSQPDQQHSYFLLWL
jgi:hypothetical protein